MASLFKNDSSRFCVFPIVYNNLWEFYQKHIQSVWFVSEIPVSDDLVDWNTKLNDNERFFIKNILAFFAASDGVVNENLVLNFYNEVQISEARQFYAIQIMMEAVHGETYSLLIDTYISDSNEKDLLFNAVENIPAVKKKANWALKWIEEGPKNIPEDIIESFKKLQANTQDTELYNSLQYFTKSRPSFAQRLLAFVCVEGIFFSGSFCAIYWMNSRGLLPALSISNQFISKDENLHAEFAIELYNMLDERLDEDLVHNIFKEAVAIEKEFITESLPVSLLGMNSKLMSQYIEFVADRWLVFLNYSKIYNVKQPFGFMELISVTGKSNFFELRKNSEYNRSGVGQSKEDNEIGFDEDF
jgi:ribonucleoside-diphosphate reductase beta chain